MRAKKKTVEQKKNRNSQKSVKSVRLMGMGLCGGKDMLYAIIGHFGDKSFQTINCTATDTN